LKKLLLVSLLFIGNLYSKDIPLYGYTHGFEFNLPRVFATNSSDYGVSGTYSYFDYNRGVEWAFPWLYKSETGIAHYNNSMNEDQRDYRITLSSIDLQYRKFVGEEFGGVYVSGFGRLAHLRGMRVDDKDYRYGSNTKFGVGVGIGYRFFYPNLRVYGGVGIMIGRYIIGENDLYYSDAWSEMDDSAFIVDVDFLKIGYAF